MGLLGPSGSGKSAWPRSVCFIIEPTTRRPKDLADDKEIWNEIRSDGVVRPPCLEKTHNNFPFRNLLPFWNEYEGGVLGKPQLGASKAAAKPRAFELWECMQRPQWLYAVLGLRFGDEADRIAIVCVPADDVCSILANELSAPINAKRVLAVVQLLRSAGQSSQRLL